MTGAEIHNSDSPQGSDHPCPAGRAWLAFAGSLLGTFALLAILIVYPPLGVTIAAVGITWFWWVYG